MAELLPSPFSLERLCSEFEYRFVDYPMVRVRGTSVISFKIEEVRFIFCGIEVEIHKK